MKSIPKYKVGDEIGYESVSGSGNWYHGIVEEVDVKEVFGYHGYATYEIGYYINATDRSNVWREQHTIQRFFNHTEFEATLDDLNGV